MDTFICTKEHPWNQEVKAAHVQHPNAVEYDGPCDDVAYYKCPWCCLTFKVELPQ